MDEQYKILKEKALENIHGSTILETTLLSFLMPLTCILHYVFFQKTKHEKSIFHILKEQLAWTVPYILGLSIFANQVYIYSIIIGIFLLLFYIFNQDKFPFLTEEKLEEMNSKKKPFLSLYRAAVMLGVSVTILLVDFPNAFPNRFGKVKEYGISMMDMGVGSFVFSSAFTSQVSSRNLFSILKSIIPMVMIGILRSLSVYWTNYQQIVTEYGVHWNFFFTLAFVALIVGLIGSEKHQILYSILFGFIHQIFLYSGIELYILNDVRINFIDQNKEGICTILGYISIYYFSSGIGVMFKNAKSREGWKKLTLKLWSLVAFLYIILYLINIYLPISRRMVNVPYIIMCVGLNCFLVGSFLLFSLITPVHSPLMVDIVNKNQLIFFLFANIFTGIVNFSFNTLTISFIPSAIIVQIYIILVTLFRVFTIKIGF